jgi:UDP-N-acetylmuramoylalanine--D-glutamate ligase
VATADRLLAPVVTRLKFSIHGRADYMVEDGYLVGPDGMQLIAVRELPRSFPHDIANALAASAVAISAGAAARVCRKTLAAAGPLPHRVNLVAEQDGVSWYDDSKAMTPASVLAAVAGFSSVVLIAGGRNKGLGLGALANAAPPVRAVVAIGEASAEIENAFSGIVPVITATSMRAAVEAARQLAHRGDAVLLSPGCASFDWYSSYAARGDDFVSMVTKDKEEENHGAH